MAMHIRSEAADAAPNAQQQPQSLWSRMSPMTSAHSGQLVSLSNDSGRSVALNSAEVARVAFDSSSALLCAWTPQRLLLAPTSRPAKRVLTPAFHSTPGDALISSMRAARAATCGLAEAVEARPRSRVQRNFIVCGAVQSWWDSLQLRVAAAAECHRSEGRT